MNGRLFEQTLGRMEECRDAGKIVVVTEAGMELPAGVNHIWDPLSLDQYARELPPRPILEFGGRIWMLPAH